MDVTINVMFYATGSRNEINDPRFTYTMCFFSVNDIHVGQGFWLDLDFWKDKTKIRVTIRYNFGYTVDAMNSVTAFTSIKQILAFLLALLPTHRYGPLYSLGDPTLLGFTKLGDVTTKYTSRVRRYKLREQLDILEDQQQTKKLIF